MKLIVIAAILLASNLSFAHSGGTDRDGCHTNHRTGDRHCH
ncbi:MAG: YHYH domain-containing protein [Rhodoferax sp.]|nr:YHYH domain-containing protein [Rhodoferax sp.]MDZ7892362.1 YHYH domain-containing protein [Rhodoferax sp.]